MGLLWAFGGFLFLVCTFHFRFLMRLYNNAAKIFGTERVLYRRLEIYEWKVTYKACGSCYVISTSAWVYFFEKSFRVPKIVPKVNGKGCFFILRAGTYSISNCLRSRMISCCNTSGVGNSNRYLEAKI